jgi:membrane carboxypeptidase/penicillin-binding protein
VAILAILPKSQNSLHPFDEVERATTRRNGLLGQMQGLGLLRDQDAMTARSAQLGAVDPLWEYAAR